MKLTKEKLKKMIKEEILKIVEEDVIEEEEDVDSTIEKGKQAMKQEAAAILSKIEAATQNTTMSPEMLRGFLIQYINEK